MPDSFTVSSMSEMTRIGEYVRGTRSLVIAIGTEGTRGVGKNGWGWGSVGACGVVGDDKGGISSAVTEISCSKFGSKNAIGPPLG